MYEKLVQIPENVIAIHNDLRERDVSWDYAAYHVKS
jgi:hypothetical protein